jgi:hypothetical protein
MGRNVVVGEAGEEVVTLPFGAMVKPHGAGGEEKKPKSLLPDVDMDEAYRKGGESAEAFYKGMLDAARSAISGARRDINSTRFDSKDEAREAIASYREMEQEYDRLLDRRARADEFDHRRKMQMIRAVEQEEREAAQRQEQRDDRAAARQERQAETTVDTMADAGTDAGTAFSENLNDSMDTGAIIDQVMSLKDEFIDTMKASAGATEDTTSAVESFNEEVANIVGNVKDMSKGTEKATSNISDEFETVTEDAEEMGETVGDELVDGIASGADQATQALGSVSDMMKRVSGTAIDPSVGVDSKSASSELKDVASELTKIGSMNESASVDVNVDDSEWQAFLNDVQKNAQLGVTVTATVKEKAAPKKRLGGQVSFERDIPHAANGRMITVGEAGEENVVLPFGAMVMPHDASISRNRAEAQTAGNVQIFGSVTIIPPTPNIHDAVLTQFMSMQRDS